MQIHSKSMKNATSPLFLGRCLILFVLSDRAWCGLQNFYTEFWNSLIMQNVIVPIPGNRCLRLAVKPCISNKVAYCETFFFPPPHRVTYIPHSTAAALLESGSVTSGSPSGSLSPRLIPPSRPSNYPRQVRMCPRSKSSEWKRVKCLYISHGSCIHMCLVRFLYAQWSYIVDASLCATDLLITNVSHTFSYIERNW